MSRLDAVQINEAFSFRLIHRAIRSDLAIGRLKIVEITCLNVGFPNQIQVLVITVNMILLIGMISTLNNSNAAKTVIIKEMISRYAGIPLS